MLKTYDERTKLCNYICALLMLCLLILQFTPFWNYGNDSFSINGYVWLEPENTDIAARFNSQLGSVPNINSIVISAVLILLFGAAGIVLCIIKPYTWLTSLLPVATGLSAIYAFALKPVFRLGSTLVIQFLLSIAILIIVIIAVINGIKKARQGDADKKTFSQADIDARIAVIKSLATEKNNKKNKSEDSDAN